MGRSVPVSRVLFLWQVPLPQAAAIPLGARLPGPSSDRTRGLGGPPIFSPHRAGSPSYLVLLRVGFA